MKYLPVGYNTKELEKSVKNKWRWEWLNETDSAGNKWSEWLKKPDICGVAFCFVCGKTVSYKSNGKKALRIHNDDATHKRNCRILRTNQVLPGSSKAEEKTESMQDRVAKQRAIITAFMSEHCLPFTIADDLLELTKRLSQDKPALLKTTLSATSATYITTHGVAKSLKDEIRSKLKGQMLSLNLDEATNNNNDKILNILVQFFDEEEQKVILRHLGSRKQNLATAANILESIEEVLHEYSIEWDQVVSVLMDNCSTMRGVRGGVETLIRQKNHHLLNISGDTVHMINNVAKAMMNCVDANTQSLCSDLFYDIEESPKVKQVFHELQTLMNAKTSKHLIRPISSRFLQMLDVCTRVTDMLDCLTVYYYGYLTEEEKTTQRALVSQIFEDNHVSDEAQAAVILLQLTQDSQQKSVTSKDRKDRILSQLFQNRRETVVKINLHRGLLSMFQSYVKYFQTEKPTVHMLHEMLVETTKKYLGMFLKAEHIPDRVSKLLKLDVTDRTIQKADKDLAVGKYAYTDINKARLDKSCQHWLTSLYSDLRTGYIAGAKKMLQLPIDNKTLRLLSVLDPELVGHDQAAASLKKLAGQLPQLFTDQEHGQLSLEAEHYNVDQQVKDLAQEYIKSNKELSIDADYWVKVFQLRDSAVPRYPMLRKLTASLLSIFSGPLVESSFNIMDDIVEKDRSKLSVVNYEAVAIIKTTLRKKGIKSTKMHIDANMKRSCINAYQTYKEYMEKKKVDENRKKEEKLSISVQLLKIERAKKIAKLVRLKNRILSKEERQICRKRKIEISALDKSKTSDKWKRIRLL